MKFNLDLKTLIVILAIACTLGGFYYSTNLRLDGSEADIRSLKTQIIDMRIWNKEIDKKIHDIKHLQRKINEKED